MSKRSSFQIAALLVFLSTAIAGLAQIRSGTLVGKVVDPSGAPATGPHMVKFGSLFNVVATCSRAVLSDHMSVVPPASSDRVNAGTTTGMMPSSSRPIVMSELVALPCFNNTAITLSRLCRLVTGSRKGPS